MRSEKEIKERIRQLATDEFLSALSEIAKLYGWEGDYGEVSLFVEYVYKIKGIPMPDLTPEDLNV